MYTLTNYNCGDASTPWFNWTVEGNLGDKYFDCEARGYQWQVGDGPTPSYTQVMWPSDVEDWMTKYNGATVTITISRNAAGTQYTITHTSNVKGTTAGNTDKYYGGTWTVAVNAEDNWNICITEESSHFDVTKVTYTDASSNTYSTAIESLPYSRTWTSGQKSFPFNAGEAVAGTNITAWSKNSNSSATAYAYFDSDPSSNGNQAYSLSEYETVTVSFTAYEGWVGTANTATIKLLNSEGVSLVEYVYNVNSTNVTDVKFNGTTATGFANFSGISKYNSTQNANGFTGNGKPYLTTTNYNPTVTFTVSENGDVTFEFVSENAGTKSFNATLPTSGGSAVKMDLASICVVDEITNSDRALGINNLSITSEFLTPPTISVSASSSMVKKDETETLTANVTGNPTIQWYSNTTNSTEGAAAIPSATNMTYNPSTASNGTTYYYAVATNVIGSTTSNIIPVTVASYQEDFSAAGKSVAKVISYNTSDEELTSTNATISGGHMYVSNYKNEDQTVVTSGGKFQINANAVFFKVVLNDALQAGDIISASVGNQTGYGISIYAEYSIGGKPSTDNHADLSTTKNDFETKTYTIKNSDTYLIGQNTFYVYRLTANGTYFDNLTVSRPIVVSGKIGSTGWTTFSSNYKLDLNVISGGDASAYYASSSSVSSVTLKTTTDIVDEGEGLLIKGTAGETFTIAKSSSDATFGQTNLLVGCPNGETLSTNSNYYVLVNNSGTAEFQSLEEHGASIPAGKAYLNTTVTAAKSLRVVIDGETTEVVAPEVAETEEPEVLYNMAGLRVGKDYKGIVINQKGVKRFNR